jgi:hypothetical protein
VRQKKEWQRVKFRSRRKKRDEETAEKKKERKGVRGG